MFFSIITVCYNSEKTIRRTFDSMLNQSFQDYEYLVIDGKSSDHTVDIIKEYEPRFNGRMHWVSEPDKGLYDAMNKGVRMAKGQLIGIINSDDYYHRNALQYAYECCQQNPGSDVYYGIQADVNSSGRCVNVKRASHLDLEFDTINHEASFITAETYRKTGGYAGEKYPIVADYDFFLRIYLNHGRFTEIDHVIMYFSDDGTSGRNLYQTVLGNLRVRKDYGLVSFWGTLIRYPWLWCVVSGKKLFKLYRHLGTKNR